MSRNYKRKTVTKFEGDPRIFMDEDGSYLLWRGGQPVMDSGLENAVLISLFTRNDPKPWYGNYLYPNTDYHIGSKYEQAMEQPITLSSLNLARIEAENALNWMIQKGLAKSIVVDITNPSFNTINTTVKIEAPDLTTAELLLLKNGVNWIYQVEDPAHGRTTDGS